MGEGEGGEEIGLIFSSSILDPKAADRDLLKARNMEMVSAIGYQEPNKRHLFVCQTAGLL
jgi:hypothetical protein